MEIGKESVTVDFWGDFACFSYPFAKIDRLTSPVPTPSAARGMLDAIYCKPPEFFWAVRKIEVMNPIKYINMARNEPMSPISFPNNGGKVVPVDVQETMNPRLSIMLKDVYYRITADVIMRDTNVTGNPTGIREQAERRIRKGQCFKQPFLGTRECVAYFSEPDMSRKPIQQSGDFGLMVYDTFILNPHLNCMTESPSSVSLYHCVMNNGVIDVPDYYSDEVFRREA